MLAPEFTQCGNGDGAPGASWYAPKWGSSLFGKAQRVGVPETGLSDTSHKNIDKPLDGNRL